MADHSVMRPEVRRVRSHEGQELRAIRLAALSESPFAFRSSYEVEATRADEQWTTRARAGADGVDRVTFFALVNDRVVGLIGAFRPESGGSVVELVSTWISPETRRKGVGSALVGAVLDWARDCRSTVVHLWVTGGNVPARRLYETMGFRETGESRPLRSDPSLDEVGMNLDI